MEKEQVSRVERFTAAFIGHEQNEYTRRVRLIKWGILFVFFAIMLGDVALHWKDYRHAAQEQLRVEEQQHAAAEQAQGKAVWDTLMGSVGDSPPAAGPGLKAGRR